MRADEKGKADPRHARAEAGMPQRGALGPRRKVAARPASRIAETHRDNRDLSRVVKLFPRQLEPGAQAVARRVVPGDPRLVDPAPRRLADDQQRDGR